LETEFCKSELKRLKCCILIPTYNNEKTVFRVVEEVLTYAHDVIVVNDGATDNTPNLLAKFGDKIHLVVHPKNQGKGMALRNGFKKALELGFKHCISIDSDGQHLPKDIPAFVNRFNEVPDSLIIGARNMNQEGVPGKSSFGNKFSNFWFAVETGTSLPDTQSGFRWYPLHLMKNTFYVTRKFEFEIEVIVRAAWKNITCTSVPISVIYNDERVTHFRPFKDFTRISILNTVLFTLAILFFRWKLAIQNFSISKIIEFIKKHLLDPTESVEKKAVAIGFGIFMGIFPIWGWQMITGIAICHFFRINKGIFLIAAQISIPPFIPFILYGSFLLGGVMLGNDVSLDFSHGISFETVKIHLTQYLTGAVALATLAGFVGGALSYIVMKLIKK